MRDMNVRTAATRHIIIVSSPDKIICSDSEGVSLGHLYLGKNDLWFLHAVY